MRFASQLGAVLLAASALISTSRSGQAEVLLNDTFNAENGGNGQGVYSSFANFTTADVDLLGPGYFFSLCQSAGDSTPCVDMEGNGNGSLTTRTAYAFSPGSVSIQFDLAGDQRGAGGNTVTASLVSTLGEILFSEAFSLPAAAPFTTFNRTVELASPVSARLQFVSSGRADSFGLLLDNVVLAADPGSDPQPDPGSGPQPVPEPASALLLGLGLAGLLVARRHSGTTPVT